MCAPSSLRAWKPVVQRPATAQFPGGRRVHRLAGVPAAGAGALGQHELLGPVPEPVPYGVGQQPLGHRRAADVAHADVQDDERGLAHRLAHAGSPTSSMPGATLRSSSSEIAPARSTRGTSPVTSTMVDGAVSSLGPPSR